jgi:CRP-like cAMP-binding protein
MHRLPTTPADTVQFSRIVRRLKFFGALNMMMLERILDGLQIFEYAKGEKVCVQGATGDTFFVVHQGRLSVSFKKGSLSFSRRVATLEPGDCFGEMALLHQAPRNATVECLTPSRIFVLPARHFQAVLEKNPEFSDQIRELAAARQSELDQWSS